jgi:uncharacterized repeat protein (TIGR01451 family)
VKGAAADPLDFAGVSIARSTKEVGMRSWQTRATLAFALSIFAAAVVRSQPAALPTLTKSFSPPSFAAGQHTVLTFILMNPAGAPAETNVGFVDTLPSGLVVANPPAVGGTCVNAAAATLAAASTITVSGLDVPAGEASCTVTVNVTNAPEQFNPSCSGNPAAFTNDAGNVSVTNVDNGISASCVAVLAPVLTKSFSTAVFPAGGSAVLTFTLANPSGSPAVSDVGFTDTLPAGLVVASPPAVGGTCVNAAAATSATAGGTAITVTGLDVPAGSAACTVTVDVTNANGASNASCSGFPAAFTNGSGNVSVTNAVNSVSPTCVVVATSATGSVPTLSPAMLGAFALALLAAGFLALRR